MSAKIPARHILAGLAAAGLAMAAAPALSQTLEELTVVGSYGPDGQPQTISRIVNISDLDLRSDAGVDVMRLRIRDTARDICDELGRSDGTRDLSVRQACITRAVATARGQMDTAIAQARASQVYAQGAPAPVYVAPSAETYAESASATVPAPTYTITTVTNGPVPDTAENRARFGGPISNGGRRTAPAGN